MQTEKRYTKILAKLWTFLLEYERYEDYIDSENCYECKNIEKETCQNCKADQEKQRNAKIALEKAKEFLEKEL